MNRLLKTAQNWKKGWKFLGEKVISTPPTWEHGGIDVCSLAVLFADEELEDPGAPVAVKFSIPMSSKCAVGPPHIDISTSTQSALTPTSTHRTCLVAGISTVMGPWPK